MRRQDLDNALRQNRAPNAIMLYGESHFLIDHYLRILTDVPDANVLSLYHDEYSFAAAKAHLSQASLFGDRNVLIIKNEKKVPKNDLSALLEYARKNQDNLFVYAYYGSDYKTSYKAFDKKSGGEHVRLFPPFFNEAKSILMQEAARLGIRMDANAGAHLLATQNNDLALACNELGKLQILQRPVTSKEIDDLVYGVAEVKIEQFINTLIMKKDFKTELKRILESGEDEVRILNAVTNFMAQLYLFYAYIKLHGTADSAKVLGYKLPPFVEKERAQQSMRFQQRQYTDIIDLLLENELKMKSGGALDKNALLLATLIRLQSHI